MSKKVLAAVGGSLLIGGLVAWLTLSSLAKQRLAEEAGFLTEIYPKTAIQALDEYHFKVGEMEVYAKELSIGGEPLYLVVEVREEPIVMYRFFSPDYRLLKEVESFLPPQVFAEGLDHRTFVEKDIEYDDREELFVKVQTSGSNLSSYEILRYQDGELVNIKIRGEENNLIDFDEMSSGGGRMSFLWHSSDMRGADFYDIEGNELVFRRTVQFRNISGDGCDVYIKSAGESSFTFVERTYCGEDSGNKIYRYSVDSAEELRVFSDLYEARNSATYAPVAKVFEERCTEADSRSATFGGPNGPKTFKGLIEEAEVVKEYPDGSKVIFVPCGQGAYQSSYLITLYDGSSYIPLPIEIVNENGTRDEEYSVVWPSYNSETDLFRYQAGGNGMYSCWSGGEYKLVGKKLVLQKFIADWDCEDADGQQDEGEVIYQI